MEFKLSKESSNVGQPLYDIYSEDLNLTIKELRLAIDKKSKLKNTFWIKTGHNKFKSVMVTIGLESKD